ncbi:MAG: hypothetical protein AAFP04_00840 [Myxococcota bacterium]
MNPTYRPSEQAITAYLLGIASPKDEYQVNEWRAACAEAESQLKKRRAMLEHHTAAADRISKHVRERIAGPAISWRRLLPAGVASLAIAAVCLFVVPKRLSTDIVSFRGTPRVAVFIQRDGEAFEWKERDLVYPGDQARLRVSATDYRFVLVYFETDEGWESVVPDQSLTIPNDRWLPFGLAIDGERDKESFRVVFSKTPLSVDKGLTFATGSSDPSVIVQLITLEKAL